jgi:hypothetical protein
MIENSSDYFSQWASGALFTLECLGMSSSERILFRHENHRTRIVMRGMKKFGDVHFRWCSMKRAGQEETIALATSFGEA